MRIFRLALTIFTMLVLFIFINNVAGKIFPPTKVTGDDTKLGLSFGTDSKCTVPDSTDQLDVAPDVNSEEYKQQQEAIQAQEKAYEECLTAEQTTYEQSIKEDYNRRGADQTRNVYVVLGVMAIIIILSLMTFRKLPLFTGALFAAGFLFTLYFPVSNVVSSYYSSLYAMSDEVKNQLQQATIISSGVGSLLLLLAHIFFFERGRKASQTGLAPTSGSGSTTPSIPPTPTTPANDVSYSVESADTHYDDQHQY